MRHLKNFLLVCVIFVLGTNVCANGFGISNESFEQNVVSTHNYEDTYYEVKLLEGEVVFEKKKATESGMATSALEIELPENDDSSLSLMSLDNLSQSRDLIIANAAKIIIQNEGNYGSVNKNDNNHGMSIGKFQWNAYWGRALPLLQTIVKANPTNAKNILGTSLYNEIANNPSTYWNHKERAATDDEATRISTLLVTAEGKAAQDALIAVDAASYVDNGINLGIISGPALVYYADLRNQWGNTSATMAEIAKNSVGSYDKVTLYALHQAALGYSSSYHTRRTRTYNFALSLGWSENIGDNVQKPQLPKPNITINGTVYPDKTEITNLNVKAGDNITLGWGSSHSAVKDFPYVVKKLNGDPEHDNISESGTEIVRGTGGINAITVNLSKGSGWYKFAVGSLSSSDAYSGSDWAWIYVKVGDDAINVGDVNGDGKINYIDAILILRYNPNAENLTATQKEKSDMNGDGMINYIDAIMVLRYR